jgi:hypothetical protein
MGHFLQTITLIIFKIYQFIGSTKGLNLKISNIAKTRYHEIRLFEFCASDGRTITSFFQVIELPNVSLGCFDTIEDAMGLIDSLSVAKSHIEKPASFFTGTISGVHADEFPKKLSK